MSESVLQRQLARLGLSADRAPDDAAWAAFLRKVGSTYDGHEQDRYLLERSMALSSAEMAELHDALRRDRERLRAVIDSLDVGLIVLGSDLRVELSNPESARILGVSLEELGTWSLADLLTCAHDDPHITALLDGLRGAGGVHPVRGSCHDARICDRDGHCIPVSASVVPVEHAGQGHSAVVVLRDLSDQHRLEVELRQAQKLEAVGRLAAGIAHELNTPIQFIGDNLRFIRSSLGELLALVETTRTSARTLGREAAPDLGGDAPTGADAAPRTLADDDLAFLTEELPAALAQSMEGVDRVTSIVRAMKSFAHPGSATAAPADINQAIRDSVTVARNEFKDIADVDLQLGELPGVVCLIHDLKQVFLNLVVNAAHAIADRQRVAPGRGMITLATRIEGDQAVISVRDDGCGIPAAIAEHVYEPFFTTKEVGRGSGQGLALARSVVVEGHGGTIRLDSTVGVGTDFEIRLPVKGR